MVRRVLNKDAVTKAFQENSRKTFCYKRGHRFAEVLKSQ